MKNADPSIRDARIIRNLVFLDVVLILSLIVIGSLVFFAVDEVGRATHLFSQYSAPLYNHTARLYLTLKEEAELARRIIACKDPSLVDWEMKDLAHLKNSFLTDAKSAFDLAGQKPELARLPDITRNYVIFLQRIERLAALKKTVLQKHEEATAIVSAFDAKRLTVVSVLQDLVFSAETAMNQFEEKSKLLAVSETASREELTDILSSTFNARYPVVQGAHKAEDFLFEIQILFQEYIHEQDPEKIKNQEKRFGQLFDRFERQLKTIRLRLSEDEYKQGFASLNEEVSAMHAMVEGPKGLTGIYGDYLRSQTEMDNVGLEIGSLYSACEQTTRTILNAVEELNETTRAKADVAVLRAKLFVAAILLFSLALSVVVGILFVRLFRLSVKSRHDLLAAKSLAEEVSRQKTDFLANISHEIRTPLMGILGYAELVASGNDAGRMRRQGQEILSQSEYLISLVNDLLDTAKITAGKMTLEPSTFDLPRMLRSVETTVRILTEKKGLALDTNVPPDLPRAIVADRTRLKQVLLNLLGNAARYTDRGHVLFEVHCENQRDGHTTLTFAIEDSGTGISAEDTKSLFTRFEQGDKKGARRRGGTGLGLSLSQALVKLMGGEIQVDSTPGRGTRFFFSVTCPVDPDFVPQEDGSPEGNEPVAGEKRDVLVVEDYPVNRDILRVHLESAGYTVTTAATGESALAAVKHKPFDLILMDVNLPDMDGMAVARQIRAAELGRSDRVPILAITAALDSETRDQVLASGMDYLLTKPIQRRPFLKAVAEWIS